MFPEQTFDWHNLGLVCTKCNTLKGDRYPATPPLDPYGDDPSEHLMPIGELIWPKPGNDRAQVTESLLKLNRAELVNRRRERMEVIRRLADAIVRSNNADVRTVLLEQLRTELNDDQEYLMVCRALRRTSTMPPHDGRLDV